MFKVEYIADFFLKAIDREQGSSITPLKLQKLLYFTQGHYMAKYDKPLFEDDFEAWTHGPVIRTIYNKYRGYGMNSIDEPKDFWNNPELSKEAKEVIEYVLNEYGKYDGKYLEMLTHKEKPWINHYNSASSFNDEVIPKDEIMLYYKECKCGIR